jgi:ATP-dependent RNA helicase DDX42
LTVFFFLLNLAKTPAKEEEKEEEEDDPLDAFMADMSEQAKTQKVEPKVH